MRKQVEATKPQRPIIAELLADPVVPVFRIAGEIKADVDAALEVNAGGQQFIAATALARALKARHTLPQSVENITRGLRKYAGGWK